jgi:hypothetical protein
MTGSDFNEAVLTEACSKAQPETGHEALIAGLQPALPGLALRHVATRTGWHRIGGVVTADFQRVAHSLREWAETVSGHDMFALYEDFADSGLITTRFDGKTHYFAAPTGPRAPDFVQIEVEELVEVADRPLFVNGDVPDDIEELIDPPGAFAARLPARVLTPPRYFFHAVTDIDKLVADQVGSQGSDLRYIRFLEEWDRSSAGISREFCRHFALRRLPFRDRFGERKIEATPLSAIPLEQPDPAVADISGVALARYLQDYDRRGGFPMAWYFAMLIEKRALITLAQAVYLDHQRNYRYLAERDFALLAEWMKTPYSF